MNGGRGERDEQTGAGEDGEPTLAAAVARPLSARGLATAAVVAAPVLLTPLGPGASWSVVAGAALAVAYFALVVQVWEGRPGFPVARPGAGARSRGDMHATLGRAFALFVLGVLPFLAAAALGAATDPSLTPSDVLAAMLVTSFYMPAAIGAVVVSRHAATAFWPFAWMRVIGSVGPAAYARLVAGFALTTALVWAGMQAGARLEPMIAPDGPTATSTMVASVAVYVRTVGVDVLWLVQAAVVGAFLRRHREELAQPS